jgi:FkbM family methyltransferase
VKVFSREVKAFASNHRSVQVILYPAIMVRRAFLGTRRQLREYRYRRILRNTTDRNVVVDLPDFQGRFVLDARSDLFRIITVLGGYESDLVPLARLHIRPGKDVIDVGANVGFFSVLAAQLIAGGNRVLAVEPDPSALALLRENLRINACEKNVQVFEGAATDAPGRFTLNVVKGKPEYSSLGELAFSRYGFSPADMTATAIDGAPLDHLVRQFSLNPGFIKIDAEGAELRVLQGALQTLREHKPVILSELCEELLLKSGATSAEVVKLLEASGYTVCNPGDGDRPIPSPFTGEILAIPAAPGAS